jgi:hypothetical protein
MVIEDTDMVPSRMNGNEVSSLIHNLCYTFNFHQTLFTHLSLPFLSFVQYKAGRFAYTLRTHLFKEHLGLLKDHEHSIGNDMRATMQNMQTRRGSMMPDSTGVLNIPCASPKSYDESSDSADTIVMDPLDDDFYYNYWHRLAIRNTQIYRRLFHCVPDDTGKFANMFIGREDVDLCLTNAFSFQWARSKSTSDSYQTLLAYLLVTLQTQTASRLMR